LTIATHGLRIIIIIIIPAGAPVDERRFNRAFNDATPVPLRRGFLLLLAAQFPDRSRRFRCARIVVGVGPGVARHASVSLLFRARATSTFMLLLLLLLLLVLVVVMVML